MRGLIVFLVVVGAVILFIFLLSKAKKGGENFSEKYVEKPVSESLRGLQAEAKENLVLIARKESAYYAETGRYATSLDQLNFYPPAGSRYKYTIDEATDRGFVARAYGNLDNDPTLDVWLIREDGKLENVVDDVSE